MNRVRRPSLAVLGLAACLLLAVPEAAVSQELMSPNEALKLLGRLEGTWEGLQLGKTTVSVSYEVIARGTAVIEVIGRGTEKEMATVYAVEDNELIAQHYCLGGYRTTMRLNRERSTPERLTFDYVNLDNVSLQRSPDVFYVSGLEIQIPPENARARGTGFAYGQVHAQGLRNLGPYTTELKPKR
jgi:hypothetical protein